MSKAPAMKFQSIQAESCFVPNAMLRRKPDACSSALSTVSVRFTAKSAEGRKELPSTNAPAE